MNAWFRLASFLMLAGVVLGAFGAHGLKSRISPDSLDIYHTAVLYHFIHAGALFAVSWVSSQNPSGRSSLAGYAFTLGILLFSGSLYALAVTGQKWLGAVTPLGGIAFIVGWAVLALGV